MDPVVQHFERLYARFGNATMLSRADGTVLITVPGARLPPGWNAESVTVYFVAPVGYPAARPDCFWTDPNLRLASGMMPANAQMNANHGGPEQLLWFSYHPTTWNPLQDDLLTYFQIISTRLREAR